MTACILDNASLTTMTMVELVNISAARRKGNAKQYATFNLVIQLAEIGIDIANDPLDLNGRERAKAWERFDANVHLARMICRNIFKYMAYSKLAPGKISNISKFKFTYVYSNIHGHFVTKY
jgi:hypothetical protein